MRACVYILCIPTARPRELIVNNHSATNSRLLFAQSLLMPLSRRPIICGPCRAAERIHASPPGWAFGSPVKQSPVAGTRAQGLRSCPLASRHGVVTPGFKPSGGQQSRNSPTRGQPCRLVMLRKTNATIQLTANVNPQEVYIEFGFANWTRELGIGCLFLTVSEPAPHLGSLDQHLIGCVLCRFPVGFPVFAGDAVPLTIDS